jgi:hypothetical protein
VPEAIWLVFELGRVIMPLKISPKFHEDLTTTICEKSGKMRIVQFVFINNGHNSEVAETIWLIIKLGRDIMLINMFPQVS